MIDTRLDTSADVLKEALCHDIIENCADAIVVVDADQTITYANKSAELMFGRSDDGFVGKPLHILIPEQVRTKHRSLAISYRDGNEPARFMENRSVPIQGVRADGSEFPVNISILKSGSGSNVMMVAIIRDVAEQKKLEEELERLANTDPLTGILNRRTFLSRAEEECDRARRYDRPMALAMIDIDHFKAVNDSFGHVTGDQAICHVANVISSGLRKPAVFCRWGGEEFALILTETDDQPALITAQRLRRSIQDTPLVPDTAGDPPIQLRVSIGVGDFNPGQETLEELIDRVDQALYSAKRTGRNKVCAIGKISNKSSVRA